MATLTEFLQNSVFQHFNDSLLLAAIYAALLVEVRHHIKLEEKSKPYFPKIFLFTVSYILSALTALFLLLPIYFVLWILSSLL